MKLFLFLILFLPTCFCYAQDNATVDATVDATVETSDAPAEDGAATESADETPKGKGNVSGMEDSIFENPFIRLILTGVLIVVVGWVILYSREINMLKEARLQKKSKTVSNPSEQSADLPNEIGSKLDVLIEAQIEANKNLNLIKRFAVIGTITLFAILSWTAKGHTGSWWGWFGFLF